MSTEKRVVGLMKYNTWQTLKKCTEDELRRMIQLHREAVLAYKTGPALFMFGIPARNCRKELRRRKIYHSRLIIRRQYWTR